MCRNEALLRAGPSDDDSDAEDNFDKYSFERGFRECESGKPATPNPYDPRSWQGRSWQAGWAEAAAGIQSSERDEYWKVPFTPPGSFVGQSAALCPDIVPYNVAGETTLIILCSNKGGGWQPYACMLPHQVYRHDIRKYLREHPDVFEVAAFPVKSDSFIEIYKRRP